MNRAAIGLTKPAAGVMATKPATAPEMAPSALGLPLRNHSAPAHPTTAAAAAKCVATNALVARLGRQRTSGIEAEPSYPQKACSDKAEHDAMRRHSLAWIAETASQINCTDQGRD